MLNLLIVLLSFSGIMAQSSKKPRYLKPTNYQKRITTIVSEKSRYYYSLSTNTPSLITVKGPGVIRVLSRGRFVPDAGKNIKYEVLYSVDGVEWNHVEISDVKRSTEAKYLKTSLGVPGQLKDFEIKLDRGYHSIEFKVKENEIPVAMRYKFIPTKAKEQEWVAFCPLRPSEPVDLISREKTYHYYRFSIENPLRVEVIGPTQLLVLSRIENHFQMKGRIYYRLQVKTEGEIINTYQLSSLRSEIAVYIDDESLIPGKACEFAIRVPEGKHIYKIIPLDENNSSVLGRFMLPKKDIKFYD